MKTSAKPHDRTGKLLAAVLVCLGVAIVVFGFRYYDAQKQELEQAARETLVAVADLKVEQIREWRTEMLGDAEWVFQGSTLGNDVDSLFSDPIGSAALYRRTLWLITWQKYQQYSRALLLDTTGRVLLAAPPEKKKLGPRALDFAVRTVRENKVLVSDLHQSVSSPGTVNMDIFVPVIERKDAVTSGRVVGVLMLEVDPNAFLYPMIEEWPTPSHSAETLLVRREGDAVLFLNELRHRKNTALKLSLPITNKQMPAVRAVLGEEGFMEGMDYRGVPVLAALRKIPDSPWFIVAKQDRGEILAPLRQQAWSTGTTVGALMLTVMLGLVLLWRRRELLFTVHALAERTQAEAALRESEVLHRTLVENIPQMVFMKDRQFHWVSVNERFARVLGVRPEDVKGKVDADFFPQDLTDKYRADDERIMQNGVTEEIDEEFLERGERRAIHTIKTPVRNAAGQVTGVMGVFSDITERKRAEAALKKSESRLRETQQMAKLGHWMWDVKTNAVEWSEEVFQIFRLDPSTFIPRIDSILALSPWPEDHERDKELVRQATESHSKGEYEQRFLRPDGSTGYYHSTFQGSYDDSGKLAAIIGTVMDITERRQTEIALRESEERFRTLVETAPEAIFIQSQGLFSYVNAAALKLFGTAHPEDLIGQPVLGRIHADHQSQVRERIRKINEQNQPADSADTVFVTVDGALKHVSTAGVPFRHQDQIGALVFARDITERKNAEEALRQSEERLHRAIANSPFPIMLHAEDGSVLQISNSWCEITGYTREELATTADWAERAYGEKKVLVQEDIERLYGMEKRKAEGDYTFRTKRGETRTWEFSSAPMGRLPDGRRLVISMAMDVTERRAGETEVRRLNDELELRVIDRTAELEATNKELEAFSYSVSHDLRAPLRAIDGFANILDKDYMVRLDKEGQRVLGIICGEAKRMGQLIDDLLAFSRLNRRSMQTGAIDMTALARTVFDECAAREPGRPFQFKLQPLPSAEGDPSMIRQMLVNLIANSIKYTRPKNPAEIEIGCRREGEENIYYVKDNGVGFDLKYVSKLFGVFQRLHTEDEFEGTGVGLALVQRIIHRHGGRVWADAKINEGATFFFTLPTRANL
jgi:PAS domain S-box-containing protein